MPLRPPAGFISAFYDPLNNPNAPTSVAASGGDGSASVSFTPPANVGGSAISAYYAVSTPGQITSSGASSPVTVTGLTNGTPYTFQVWALNTYGPGPFSAASGSVSPAAPTGLFAGGDNSEVHISSISISSTGNATNFGDLSVGGYSFGSVSSSTRGLWGGGRRGGARTNLIDYVTFATAGNAVTFGNLIAPMDGSPAGFSSSTRGVFAGGEITGSGAVNVIQYVTIATTGNTTDFGDLLSNTRFASGLSSQTRGVVSGGSVTSPSINTIQYVTIATTGNAVYFGDLIIEVRSPTACSNNTRGLVGGGWREQATQTLYNVIQYVTIASTGNAVDFGDLVADIYSFGACSSSTRAVFGGGYSTNVIQYVSINTTGNALDFGDLATNSNWGQCGACSNAHGGL